MQSMACEYPGCWQIPPAPAETAGAVMSGDGRPENHLSKSRGNKELIHLLKSYSQAKNQLIQKKWHDLSISDEAAYSNLSSFTEG